MNNGVRRPLTRRALLARASITGAALVAGPGLKTTPANAAPPLVLGEGTHRYECIHDFLVPPPNIKWGDTHGLTQDKAGRIYVTHTVHPESPSGDAVVVFGPDGKFVTSWGERFRGGGHGIGIRSENGTEYLYHCDIKNRKAVKTTLDGTVVWERGAPEEAGVYKNGAGFTPTNVAFVPDGDVWIADGYGSSYVHRYGADGTYKATFGGPGKEAGKFQTPHGAWLDTRGKNPLLAVADRANRRIQYMDLEGKHVRFSENGMRLPCNFDVRGDLLLVPDLDSVLTLLDADNKVVVQLGDGYPSNLRSAPREQFIPGKFIHPHDAIFLQNGDILVAEWVPIGRITLLRKLPG